jgi:uncharacterized protein YecE (DUF72 family)
MALPERVMNRSGNRELHPVHVGCSGWNYKDWREVIYPKGLPASRWLERYSSLFDTVEVNATFYRLVSRDAVARWVNETPAQFVFAVKASRYLTHVKRLTGIAAGVETFHERLEPLIEADRLGPILWQLPESFRRDDQRLADALAELPSGRHALELRHSSWFAPDVYALLREHEVALVIGDHPDRPFQTYESTAPWRYIRLHYGSRGRRGNYSEKEIESWAERIHGWRAGGAIYVYFNNDWKAYAPRNASRLSTRLDRLATRDRGDSAERSS